MRVVFYVNYPFAWAKGGHAIQIEETQKQLEKLGVDVVWLRHERAEDCEGDIMHYWSRPPHDTHWELARKRGLKIVISEYHQLAVLRPRILWQLRGVGRHLLPLVLGRGLYHMLGSDIYACSDAAIAVNKVEADYMVRVFGAKPRNVYVIPNGVAETYLDKAVPAEHFEGLVYLAYICQRKQNLAVAKAAKAANIPIRFVGGPVSGENDYLQAFRAEVDNRYVFWDGEVTDICRIAAILRGSLGSFLASSDESQGMALLESLACGTPVMGPDLSTLRAYFGESIRYCVPADRKAFIRHLKEFHADCVAGLSQTFHVLSWRDVAQQVLDVYNRVLAGGGG